MQELSHVAVAHVDAFVWHLVQAESQLHKHLLFADVDQGHGVGQAAQADPLGVYS
jgi:hypothetical protein